jgi:uncharacterized protein involved in exopolysaccharide biosynthesis
MRDVVSVVFRQRRTALLCFVATCLIVTIYAAVTPRYRSEMKILVRRGRVDPAVAPTPSQTEFVLPPVSEEDLNSEADLLCDDEILRTVVRNTGLASEAGAWWNFDRSEDARLARAVRRLRKKLEVEPGHKATIINVSYKAENPQQGVRVLQALAGAYLERHSQVHRPSGQFGFFDEQAEQSRRGLEQTEVRLMSFSQDEGVVSAALERDAALQHLGEVEADLRQTHVSRATTSERAAELQIKLSQLPQRAVTQVRNSDNPELMEKMKARLLELELKRTELLTKFDPSYRLVEEVDQEISQTKQSISLEETAPIRDQTTDRDENYEWTKSELLKAQVELGALQAHEIAQQAVLAEYREEARRLGNHAIEQDQLLHDLKEAEEKYLLYVNKREEARIGDALDHGGILNVTIAEPPTVPVLPEHSYPALGLIGIALASVVSLGGAFAADYVNPAFRTPSEVYGVLGSPVLASLPCRTGNGG